MLYCWFRFLTYKQSFRSCSAIPQLFSNSAAVQRFCSLFVVWYAPRVFSRNEPHGHVGLDVHMDRMLLVEPNQSRMPLVNAGIHSVKRSSSKRWHESREHLGHGTIAGTSSTPRRQLKTGSKHRFVSHDDRFPQKCTELPTCLLHKLISLDCVLLRS